MAIYFPLFEDCILFYVIITTLEYNSQYLAINSNQPSNILFFASQSFSLHDRLITNYYELTHRYQFLLFIIALLNTYLYNKIITNLLSTCAFVHLYTCTCVDLYICSLVHLFTCTLVYLFTCTLVHLFTCTLVHLYSCSRVHLFTCTLVHLYTCTLVHMYTCSLVLLYTCLLVHLYICLLVHL